MVSKIGLAGSKRIQRRLDSLSPLDLDLSYGKQQGERVRDLRSRIAILAVQHSRDLSQNDGIDKNKKCDLICARRPFQEIVDCPRLTRVVLRQVANHDIGIQSDHYGARLNRRLAACRGASFICSSVAALALRRFRRPLTAVISITGWISMRPASFTKKKTLSPG
jgi:hypothetical protein